MTTKEIDRSAMKNFMLMSSQLSNNDMDKFLKEF